jgi:surface-anchored protein
VTWSLDRVEGPGQLAIYLFSPFGQPQIVFTSGDGVPDRYEIPLGTHAHGNWAFTREGVYRVTFTQSATLASGAQVRDTEVVTFVIGAVDPRSALTEPNAGDGNGTCPGGVSATRLAFTGTGLRLPLTLGGLLVLAGVLIVIVNRRRRGALSAVDGER